MFIYLFIWLKVRFQIALNFEKNKISKLSTMVRATCTRQAVNLTSNITSCAKFSSAVPLLQINISANQKSPT